ncbi:ubiquitin-specific protease ubp2, partial [Linderina pennispora]
MAFESQPIGVLCAYFVNTQLAEWSPPELRKQQTKLHRHDWAQPQTHPGTLLSPSRWEATCTECLCKLRVLGVISDRTTTGGKAPCTDDLGHHFHTRLSDTPVSQIQGRSVYTGGAWCCKCNSQVELSLTAPVISSLQVAALERARAAGHEHHSTQAVREVLVTLKTMFRIAKNAVGGDVRPIKSTSPKPRQLLKFDTACNEILAAIGFVMRGDEFYPPDIVASISDDELKSSVSDSLSYQQLVAAMEELLVASGKFMRRLPPNDRDALFRYLNGAISLMQLLGSDMYPKRPGSSPLVISSNRSIIGTRSSLEEGYRRLGAPEDAADSLVAWAYLRQTEEDESDDPISGKDALERFDALQGIAAARSSKELGDLVANEEDRGLVATDALRAALGEICGDRMLEVDAI